MNAVTVSAGRAPRGRDRAAGSAGIWILGVALGALNRASPLLGATTVGILLGVAVFLAYRPRGISKAFSWGLAGLALVIAAVAAQVSPLSGLLAGAAGVAFLFWATTVAPERSGAPGAAAGLALPAVATAVALASGLLLPAASEQIGAAALLAIGVFLYLAFLLTRAEPVSPPEASAL